MAWWKEMIGKEFDSERAERAAEEAALSASTQ